MRKWYTNFKKNVTWLDKFLLFCFSFLSLIIVPVGLSQYILWFRGDSYSVPFMAAGLFAPVMIYAKLLEIARRNEKK